MDIKTRREIENYVKAMRWTPGDLYWKHAFMVRKFALLLQKQLGGDRDVVEAAALLHDVGKEELLAPGHEKISAKLAEKLLSALNFDREKINKVVECIEYQNFRLLEARILRSADSMALIMDPKGQKWYFENILQNDRKRIMGELRKSFSEIEFPFARRLVMDTFRKLMEQFGADKAEKN